MKEMSPTPPNKGCVQSAGRIYGDNADENRILELVGAGESNGGGVRDKLEQVLEGRFDSRKGASILRFHFLESVARVSIMAPTVQGGRLAS